MDRKVLRRRVTTDLEKPRDGEVKLTPLRGLTQLTEAPDAGLRRIGLLLR